LDEVLVEKPPIFSGKKTPQVKFHELFQRVWGENSKCEPSTFPVQNNQQPNKKILLQRIQQRSKKRKKPLKGLPIIIFIPKARRRANLVVAPPNWQPFCAR